MGTNVKTQKTLVYAALMPAILCSSGCATALVGGILPSNNKVTIDETTVSPELKDSLSKAKRLAFLATDKADTYVGEYLEENAGYEVSLVETSKVATLSQKRRQMETICSGSDKPDLVFAGSSGEANASTGTTLTALVTGRTDFDVTGINEVLRCRDNWKTQFSMREEISQGIYNADQTSMERIVGQEYAKALMRLAGKLQPAPATTAVTSN